MDRKLIKRKLIDYFNKEEDFDKEIEIIKINCYQDSGLKILMNIPYSAERQYEIIVKNKEFDEIVLELLELIYDDMELMAETIRTYMRIISNRL